MLYGCAAGWLAAGHPGCTSQLSHGADNLMPLIQQLQRGAGPLSRPAPLVSLLAPNILSDTAALLLTEHMLEMQA
jgi:hypothetical protein